MITTLKELIEALRGELQQYGEMLAMLDHHPDQANAGGPDELLLFVHSINTQSASIQTARKRRETLQMELARELAQPPNAQLATLTPLLPEQYRPLVAALAAENNELLNRVRRRAEENQLTLRRSLDLMQRFITTLSPREGSGSHDVPTEFITRSPGSSACQSIT